MSKDNESPDSGYTHFHEFGEKNPMGGKVVDPIGFKKARDSGSDWSTGPGIDPKTGMPKGSSQAPGGSVGGEAKKLGIT